MTRAEFTTFVEATLEDVIALAEEQSGKRLSREIAFQWLFSKDEPLRERIVAAIVDRVYVDENAIYPCVDIGVGDLLDDGTPLIVASVAGYPPRPFGQNWTGRAGPFVRIIGGPFMAKVSGSRTDGGRNTASGAFGYFIVDM